MRASNARQCELCPGSLRMQKGLPDIESVESRQGDRLHDYSAHPEYAREFLSPEEQDLLRTADQLEAQVFDTIGLKGKYIEKRECYLEDELINGHPDLMRVYGGSKDHPWGTVTVITDRKFGWALVDRADVNLQMRVYAALTQTPETYVAILQPRAPIADRITIAKYNRDAKLASWDQIKRIVAATEDPEAPLVAGEEQCRYCRARAICPELKEAITKELVPYISQDDLSKTALTARIQAKLAQARDEQLGALFRACALGRIVNDPLNDEIRRRIAAGQMDGFTVGNDYDVRSISNARKTVSLLVLGGYMPRDKALDICKMDVGSIETAYRELHKVSAKQAKADINKALAEVIEKEPRKGRILRK